MAKDTNSSLELCAVHTHRRHCDRAEPEPDHDRCQTLQHHQGYLLSRRVQSPPAGLTGGLGWRRRWLTAEGRVCVGLVAAFTVTRRVVVGRVHTHPVAAGGEHTWGERGSE